MLRTRCRLSYLADNLFSAHHFFLKMSSSKMSSSSDASSSAISHVLFDMDGLLLDTEELYSQSYQIVNDRHGAGKYTFEFKVKLMGTRPLNCAKMMIEQYKLPISPEEFVEATTKEQEKLFPGVRWMPGMLKLVHHLYKVWI